MFDKLEDLLIRFEEIMGELNEPDVTANQERFRALMKEQSDLTPIVEAYREYKKCNQDIEDSLMMLDEENDPDMREMLKEELNSAKTRVSELEEELKILLLPKDPNDEKNVIVEIRAGAGGDEAAAFRSGNLSDVCALCRASAVGGWRRWHVERESASAAMQVCQLHDYQVRVRIRGSNMRAVCIACSVCRRRRAADRIHTSTITVAIMPEAEDVDVQIGYERL